MCARVEKLEIGHTNKLMILFLVCASHGANHFASFAYPILIPVIMTEFNLSYALVGLLLTAYNTSAGLPQFLMAVLQQKINRKILLAVGSIWNALMNMFGSFTIDFNQLLVTRIFAGAGASVQHPLGSSMLAEHFSNKRMGMAMSLNIAGAAVGSLIAAPFASTLLQYFGWREALLFLGAPSMLFGIAFLFLKDTTRATSNRRLSFFRGLGAAYLTRPILVLTLVRCVLDFRMGVFSFIPIYLVNVVGFDGQTSAGLYMILYIGSIIGTVSFGIISDRVNKKYVVISTLIFSACFVCILPYLNSIYWIAILLLILGFTYQTVSPLLQALVTDFTEPEEIDRVYGIYYTIAFTMGLVGPLVFGSIADAYNFTAAFTYVSIVSLTAAIAAIFIPKR